MTHMQANKAFKDINNHMNNNDTHVSKERLNKAFNDLEDKLNNYIENSIVRIPTPPIRQASIQPQPQPHVCKSTQYDQNEKKIYTYDNNKVLGKSRKWDDAKRRCGNNLDCKYMTRQHNSRGELEYILLREIKKEINSTDEKSKTYRKRC